MRLYIIPIIVFFCSACHSSVIFEKYEELPDETWNRYHVIEFKVHIPDTGRYRIKLCVRHTTDYEMANLWCFISSRSTALVPLRDTVNLHIAEPDGRWLGQGGTIKTIEQWINRNPVFLPKGDVVFRIEQGMRSEEMKGVRNVGVKVFRKESEEMGNKKRF